MTATSLSSASAIVDVDYGDGSFDTARAIGVEAMVMLDIATRQAAGIRKYGTTLGENKAELKARLQHAYEECIDQANYLKWAITMLESEEAGK